MFIPLLHTLRKFNLFKRTLTLLSLTSSLLFSQLTFSAPTAEQIQAFQSLPKAQQEALLKKYAAQSTPTSDTDIPQQFEDTVKRPPIKRPSPDDKGADLEGTYPPDAKKSDRYSDDRYSDFTLKKDASDENIALTTPHLKRFGIELFKGEPTTFAPVNDIPIPANYVLGPGDQIKIQLYGNRSEVYTRIINRNGQLTIPELPPITLAGLTFSEAIQVLQQHIKSLGIGIKSNITLGALRSYRIFILGESNNPGSYLVSGLSTISHALYISGGINKIGSLRNIQLKRQGKVVAILDLYDFLIKGDTRNDKRLQPGDTIFIPPVQKQVSIAGEVNRPAIYEIKSEKTFRQLLQLAGGAKPTAYLAVSKLSRISEKGYRTVLDLNLTQKQDLNKPLKKGDLLTIQALRPTDDRSIILSGEVFRQGKYQWQPGIKLLDVLPAREKFTESADLHYLIIKRQPTLRGNYHTLSVNWEKAFNQPKGAENISLHPRDEIFVLNKVNPSLRKQQTSQLNAALIRQATLQEPPQIVSISGKVKFPGQYPLTPEMDLESLFIASGGLQPGADQHYALIKREDYTTGKVYFEHINLSEKDSLKLKLKPKDNLYVFSSIHGEARTNGLKQLIQLMHAQATLQEPPQIVSISGKVKFPGQYPLSKNMRLSDLIDAAGNLAINAMINEADIIRFSIVDGEKREVNRITLNLAKALKGHPKHNIALQPYDQVVIKQVSDWSDATRTITLKGELKYPGTYVIRPGETLADAIARAGGFTEWAAPENAVFLRKDLAALEQREYQALADELQKNLLFSAKKNVGLTNEGQSSSLFALGNTLIEKIKQTPALGRLVVSLDPEKTSMYQATLAIEIRDGDTLIVPKRSSEIVIMGEVARSVSMLYQPDLSVADYLSAAGGITHRADASQIYVVHGDGSIERASIGWLFTSSVTLKPGDTIVVPMDVSRINPLITWTSVSKILANFAVTAATLKTVGVIQ